jgi:HPt (histidine-containing phosphotransfer) domain-containing protein
MVQSPDRSRQINLEQEHVEVDGASVTLSMNEIQQRLRKRYIARLEERVKKMRRLLSERNWFELKVECHHLRGTGGSYGFEELSLLAARAEDAIPTGEIRKAENFPQAKQAVEALISGIDGILTDSKFEPAHS